MKKDEFVLLCLRMLGIFIISSGISSLPNAFKVFFDGSFSEGYIIASPFIHILVGAVLCVYAPKLRKYVIDFSNAEDDQFRITVDEKFARMALIILGFYIFAYAVPDLIQVSIEVGIFYKRMAEISENAKWYEHQWLYIFPPLMELSIAAVLIIGSDKIIEFLSRFDASFKKLNASNKTNSGDS